MVEGRVDLEMLRRFTRGLVYEGEKFKAEKARIVSSSRSQSIVELELAEGKYREVRRLFESQGRTVKRLQRIQVRDRNRRRPSVAYVPFLFSSPS